MKLNLKAKCSSCRAGENDEPATVYATGRYEGRPFQGYLCGAHAEMMEENGAELKIRVMQESSLCSKQAAQPTND